ncbi:MAG: secondary thiamine-phosphate synthase enzyme YjbQ [Sedimentisphaerales bacterium]|nr:secondary thiamine-phosphate synthase enzyme YjbQ [Sedimentisphaerales bacterium]
MAVAETSFQVSSNKRCQMIDITDKVQSFIAKNGVKDGQVLVFCPHTTAAITINENADPSVVDDILLTLEELIPQHRRGYRHSEGNSDAHVKSSLVGTSETLIVKNGRLLLGTWQGIYFCEFDGPRNRTVHVQVVG